MLTQPEADVLIAMGKRFENPSPMLFPRSADQTHGLIGEDNRERFLLDLWRGTIKLTKFRYQTRARKAFVLVRLDNSGRHTNPDDTIIEGPHIHLYREGYEDKWAKSLNPGEFSDPKDMGRTFNDFCRYCNIKNAPPFRGELI